MLFAIFLVLYASGPVSAQEPPLPEGLKGKPVAEEPPLPIGLEKRAEAKTVLGQEAGQGGLPFDLSGFLDACGGLRTRPDPYESRFSLGETRLELDARKDWSWLTAHTVTDFLYDPVGRDYSVNLETGQGFFDLREANLSSNALKFMDVKVGRQMLTWGTGDLLFINDLFPKDYNSFFIGRDIAYLRAPSDSLKASVFSRIANVDVVYTPRFDPDRFIDGRRISYFNPVLGRLAGRDAIINPVIPDDWFRDYELAGRVSRNISGYELAAYGYRGFWKEPLGIDVAARKASFPPLSVYGGSLRGPLGKGIANVEFGYYDSRDDRSGDDPFVPNSEFRIMAGYEQEVARDLTLGFQYYVERRLQYPNYKRSLPFGFPLLDENHHILTLRLTKLLMKQNLRLSFFAYYSPSDEDAYLRPNISYKITDHWTAEIGGNVFLGERDSTFFGEFRNNSNVYGALRWSF
jgi:hypothetical protein